MPQVINKANKGKNYAGAHTYKQGRIGQKFEGQAQLQ